MLSFPVRKGPRDQSAREAQSRRPQGGLALAEYGQSLVPPLQLSPPSITLESSSREKRPPPTYVASRDSAGSTARELNATITCGSVERRLDDGASSPLIIHAFDVTDQIADDF